MFDWFKKNKAATLAGRELTAREVQAQGPYTRLFDQWIAREVNPRLYEALREAVAPIDGAINRLVTLDGIIRVEGENEKIVRETEEWARSVQVNDLETGLQAFYRSQGNELYEQGFSVGEYVLDSKGRDVVQLRVADSKGVHFRRATELEVWYAPPARQRGGRRDGTEQLERVLRNSFSGADAIDMLHANGYRKLSPQTLVYCGFNNESDNPYGVSLMRSTEFDCKVVLTIKNALLRTWERFGDPIFNVTYKTKARIDQSELESRRVTIAQSIASALGAKRQGNSVDVVTAVGKEDEITVGVLGADGQVLEVEMPARHVLENIVSKTGLPSWMLGFHWSTAERLAQRQGEIALQESRTRFETRRAGLERIVAAMLRGRGRTWKPGDWQLVQDLPSLQDLLAQSQAAFLDAQRELMLAGAGGQQEVVTPRAPKVVYAKVDAAGGIIYPPVTTPRAKASQGCKGEEYLQDARNLMRLESTAERALLAAWEGLYDSTLEVLRLDSVKGVKEPVFIFDPGLAYQALMQLEQDFVRQVGAADASLAVSEYRAWVRGVVTASEELSVGQVLGDIAEKARAALAARALELVTNTTIRAYRDEVLAALAEGAYDGQKPRDVARALRQRFEAHEYDWQRLARSEIAMASARGKLDTYREHGIEEYDWAAAGDACPICNGYQQGGPYLVGVGPMPVIDSHPACRCTVMPVDSEA